ncbi:MAG: hypothetical protein H8E26_12180 [FCB group bacterium]|jgi:hypothetical protein|nr:hypothetical protein [FCB group bacterium]
MMMDTTNVLTREYMDSMAGLMNRALEDDHGLNALAEAILPPIEMEIERKEITSLLLTRHALPAGQPAKYVKRKGVKAYWISPEGEAIHSEASKEEVEFPTVRVHSAPIIDVSSLKNGNVWDLTDLQTSAGREIRKTIDAYTLKTLSESIPPENVIEQTGLTLTEPALNQAMSILEDKELTVKTLLMRGARFNDLRSWDLDPQTKNELRTKGVIKIFGGANILTTATADMNEIIILPDEEIGKLAIRQKLTSETVKQTLKFKVGWLIWMEVAIGILRPDLCVKIKMVG